MTLDIVNIAILIIIIAGIVALHKAQMSGNHKSFDLAFFAIFISSLTCCTYNHGLIEYFFAVMAVGFAIAFVVTFAKYHNELAKPKGVKKND